MIYYALKSGWPFFDLALAHGIAIVAGKFHEDVRLSDGGAAYRVEAEGTKKEDPSVLLHAMDFWRLYEDDAEAQKKIGDMERVLAAASPLDTWKRPRPLKVDVSPPRGLSLGNYVDGGFSKAQRGKSLSEKQLSVELEAGTFAVIGILYGCLTLSVRAGGQRHRVQSMPEPSAEGVDEANVNRILGEIRQAYRNSLPPGLVGLPAVAYIAVHLAELLSKSYFEEGEDRPLGLQAVRYQVMQPIQGGNFTPMYTGRFPMRSLSTVRDEELCEQLKKGLRDPDVGPPLAEFLGNPTKASLAPLAIAALSRQKSFKVPAESYGEVLRHACG